MQESGVSPCDWRQGHGQVKLSMCLHGLHHDQEAPGSMQAHEKPAVGAVFPDRTDQRCDGGNWHEWIAHVPPDWLLGMEACAHRGLPSVGRTPGLAQKRA